MASQREGNQADGFGRALAKGKTFQTLGALFIDGVYRSSARDLPVCAVRAGEEVLEMEIGGFKWRSRIIENFGFPAASEIADRPGKKSCVKARGGE